ncbi:MAG: EamA family transporter RarD [Alphaproteobacteria bacterium]|nr:MAG: EamA family transporter RarD [Alphaproteobacteria bacterium]
MSEAAPITTSPSEAERRAGFIAAASAYVMWGFLPLYLKLLGSVDVREVLAQRIVWCAPAALIAVFLMSGWRPGWREIATALKPRMLATLVASAGFIFINWGLYVYLVLSERVIESALAYFLAPLVSVAVGVLFFRERITMPRVIALALALLGVIVQGFALGAPPWMALALCATWSVYAVIRKRAAVPAATGLLIESLALMPLAIGLLLWAANQAPLSFGADAGLSVLLAIAGPITAIPLMAFAFGARRVSFTTLGLLQFLAPTLQFITGIAFGEPFTLLRGVSFVLIWVGLAFFSWDTLRSAKSA